LAAQASKLPHVITAHDAPISILRHNFIPYRIARTLMAYCVLARASRVVSVSPYVADHLKRFMFYRGGKAVIPNGMPASLFEQAISIKKEQRPFTIVTALSNWCALKNGTAAIKAFTLFKRDFPSARMIMFGAGYGPDEAAEQ
jgi:L-malate glycosyltransferase